MNGRPTVSELDSWKLEAALLRAENLQLQAQAVQVALQKYREDFQTLSNGLAVEGFELRRLQDGTWVYQPIPPNEAT